MEHDALCGSRREYVVFSIRGRSGWPTRVVPEGGANVQSPLGSDRVLADHAGCLLGCLLAHAVQRAFVSVLIQMIIQDLKIIACRVKKPSGTLACSCYACGAVAVRGEMLTTLA
jgi:hypothetical protein